MFQGLDHLAIVVPDTEEALALVGLTHATHKHPHEIWGGMKERVGIARDMAKKNDMLATPPQRLGGPGRGRCRGM